MSVVGARDWFIKMGNSATLKEVLLLEKYPLAFVQEVREKLGGQFFAAADTLYEEVNELGTLLPFSGKSAAHRRVAANPVRSEDHPAVASWNINPDGSVLLPRVGIVAAYPRRSEATELARVLIPEGMPNIPATVRENVELNTFLASFCADQEKFAISLLRAGSRINGLILMRESSHYYTHLSDPFCRPLRKIATFFYNCDDEAHMTLRNGREYAFPCSTTVNWLVL
ncbi:hypothetical protein MMC18_000299 [Xylographa bjoerkii]|nr:hypothetical protein [Xylographa bjoerkii]